MSTEPFLSPGVVVLTDSRPSAKSTLVLSATLTSDRLASLMGSTSTTVSVRSLAVTRTRAPATSTVAAMGPGVANVGMTTPCLCFVRDLLLGGSTSPSWSGALLEGGKRARVPDDGDPGAPGAGGDRVAG